jgi:glycosyltransferase involved in cell wall biosynthesis
MRISLYMGTLRGHGGRALGQAVVQEMVSQGTGHDFEAWVPQPWVRSLEESDAARQGRLMLRGTQPGLSAKFRTENVSLRRALRTWKADRLFSFTDTSLVACPVPHGLLIHQAHLAYSPDEWGFAAPPRLRAQMASMVAYLKLCLPSVAFVTVQSADMKRRLCARFDLNEDDVVVVPSALGASWGKPSPRADGGQQTHPPSLLCVTNAAPHKNLAVLADTLASLSGPYAQVRLTLTVEAGSAPRFVERAAQLGVLDRVDFVGVCAPTDLARLARGATLSIQPSMLESFGLTYYEAMAAGLPVIAADRAFAREACGDVALYAQGDSGEDFACQVRALLDDETVAQERGERGLQRHSEAAHTWSQVAAAYLKLITRPSLTSRT